MKIALISYEYPPDTAFGGIGTYTYQAAHMLKSRGHYVEVFAGAVNAEGSQTEEDILVHRLKVEHKEPFRRAVTDTFLLRQRIIGFDLVEVPEYEASGIYIAEQCPDIPILVKLHTPGYLVSRLFRGDILWHEKARFIATHLLKGKLPKPYWHYDHTADKEYQLTKKAQTITSPSKSLAEIVEQDWKIAADKVQHVPNLFVPEARFLDIPLPTDEPTNIINITFTGKLERRKGIPELVEAAKIFMKKYPETRLTLIGAYNHPSPVSGMDMDAFILSELKAFTERISLTGQIKPKELPKYYQDTHICIFPSIWENFPYVCLEAMSAGRAVIGSKAGGMAEMITHEENGLLVPPNNAQAIAMAVDYLVEHPHKRILFGQNGRKTVLQRYNAETIGQQTEAVYQATIDEFRKQRQQVS